MTADDFAARLKDTGRNDDCPCGSGKKYKKCCLHSDEQKQSASMAKTQKDAADKAAKEKEESEKDGSARTPEPKVPRQESHGPAAQYHGPGSVARQYNTPRKAQ